MISNVLLVSGYTAVQKKFIAWILENSTIVVYALQNVLGRF